MTDARPWLIRSTVRAATDASVTTRCKDFQPIGGTITITGLGRAEVRKLPERSWVLHVSCRVHEKCRANIACNVIFAFCILEQRDFDLVRIQSSTDSPDFITNEVDRIR